MAGVACSCERCAQCVGGTYRRSRRRSAHHRRHKTRHQHLPVLGSWSLKSLEIEGAIDAASRRTRNCSSDQPVEIETRKILLPRLRAVVTLQMAAKSKRGSRMTLSHEVSDPLPAKLPKGLAIFVLLCVAFIFSGELASVNAEGGWMLDDLFSLWVSAPAISFDVVFSDRILPDSNPPLYFSLLYFMRQLVPNDGDAVIGLNIAAIVLAALRFMFRRGAWGSPDWPLQGSRLLF